MERAETKLDKVRSHFVVSELPPNRNSLFLQHRHPAPVANRDLPICPEEFLPPFAGNYPPFVAQWICIDLSLQEAFT
jgi:hypothetical protein